MTGQRLKPEVVAVLFQQFSDALRAGLSLRQVLAILGKDTELPKVQAQFIADTTAAVRDTGTLSDALEAYASTFPPETIALIRTCEQSGQLAPALELVADDYEMRALQRLGVKGALSWPLAIMCVLGVVCAIVMIFVIPAFKQVFASFGADLPGPTLLVMAASDFFVEYWFWFFLPIAVLAVVAYRRRAQGHRFRALDAALLRIPFIRSYVTRSFFSRLTRVLERALGGNVPLLPAVAYLRATAGNSRMTDIALGLEAQLHQGKDLVAAVRDTPYMPGALATALELGAETHNPAAALRHIVALSESEAARRLMRLQQALIVSTYVITGFVVLVFVIAMYFPIFKLGSVV